MKRFRQWIVWIGFWLVVCVLAGVLYGEHQLNLDEGVVLNNAWHLWNQQILYTQVADFTPPGSAFIIYWWWQLLGEPGYTSAKLLAIGLWLLSALALADIVRRLGGKQGASAVGVMLWLIAAKYYPLINHNSFSSYLAVVWLWLAIIAEQRRTWFYYGLFGLSTAVVTLLLQTKGLTLAAASVVIILSRSQETMAWRCRTIGIWLMAWLVPLLSLVWFWPWNVLWTNLITLPFTSHYLNVNTSDYLAISLVVALVALLFLRWSMTKRRDYLILAVTQLALAVSIVNLVDYFHVAIITFPCLALLVYECVSWIQRGNVYSFKRPARLILIYLSGVFYLLVLQYLTAQSMGTLWQPQIEGHSHLAFPQAIAAKVVYAGPFLPNLYLELGQPDYFVETNNFTLCDSTCQVKSLERFKTLQPEYVWLNYVVVEKFHFFPDDDVIGNYVRSHYQQCEYPVGDFQLFTNTTCPSLEDLGIK